MIRWLRPQEELTPNDQQTGLRMLLLDGMFSQIMGSLTGGAFLIAYALLLGASNKVVGLIAAIAPLSQILQIPSIFLVDKTQHRKSLTVISAFISRLFWLGAAALPFIAPAPYRLPLFVVSLSLYFSVSSITNCSFNSWMRDVIPDDVIGRFLAKRMGLATATALGIGLIAAFGIDFYKARYPNEIYAYSIIFLIGLFFGLIGVGCLARIPEPKMAAVPHRNMVSVLVEPFRDTNYRSLLFFLGAWNFAVNLSAPFFTVYMLRRLELTMTIVLALSILSQVMTLLFIRLWGRLADRFSNKSVLTVSGPIFMISVFLWPFTMMPETHALTLPLLVLIHALAGISTAGVMLCSRGIALKTAPRGRATAYLATNALISGSAAILAPLLAGLAADGLATQEITVTLRWISNMVGHREFHLTAMHLRGLDFLFVFSFIFGLYAIHRLFAVEEVGEEKEDAVLIQFYTEIRNVIRHGSNIPGLRHLTYFPYAFLREMVNRKSR
ncbi:MAG: MFS transporter [bacterium]